MKIAKVTGREILDSRGNPTTEAEVVLENGICGRGMAPSGASTGKHEALELRDKASVRYGGKGVESAVYHIGNEIAELLEGQEISDLGEIDRHMCQADSTDDKSAFGANAILAVSIACARAAARAQGVPLFRFLGGASAVTMPVPMMNILNGGAHAANNVDVQEFMIMPVGASSFSEGLRWCAEVYHTLASVLRQNRLETAVGDEGGFAPDLAGEEEAISLILHAIEGAGYQPGRDFMLALDAAASEWKGCAGGCYRLPKSGKEYDSASLTAHWKKLCSQYPIASLEDPLDEEDWDGWSMLTDTLGGSVQLVGDDLFVTNTRRLHQGITSHCANSILIKPNQIGTVSETLAAIRMAHQFGYTAIASHRSGETEDTTIADLAVACNTGQIKTGAPCRSERVAKYNRLLRIEEALGGVAQYAGKACFGRL
ncbi:phosphopyruvate hydratase [Ruminococcus sp.]|uniref:phosphopyruvate hydratase n=1 Tax=Ruminococcus sp. TaxID=41978 RepID=UPI002E75D048|nr:phosphopyruvate hydratase [Ruminococcus sp.]MEE1396461.1 phosphopyruvate hydratase [Ruminococcus sp.]